MLTGGVFLAVIVAGAGCAGITSHRESPVCVNAVIYLRASVCNSFQVVIIAPQRAQLRAATVTHWLGTLRGKTVTGRFTWLCTNQGRWGHVCAFLSASRGDVAFWRHRQRKLIMFSSDAL